MAHIRSYFGIEREFNRYYDRLKREVIDASQINGVQVLEDMHAENN